MFDRCLYFNVNALARVVNKQWTKAFAEFDLSPAHGYMLRAILSEPGITQKQLGNELKLEKSTITRFVDALQKKQLIVRKSTDEDGRSCFIHPTRKAIAMQQSLENRGNELYQKMVETIGHDQLSNIVKQLKKSEKKLKTR